MPENMNDAMARAISQSGPFFDAPDYCASIQGRYSNEAVEASRSAQQTQQAQSTVSPFGKLTNPRY